ncbi:PP2C family protein-serine/threonine phosphatase [Catellatospora sp. KI3]|uniref:PP2C family protein-serine/threonine phosphatase n=1 Tax=Catellatospora sp. KI3 TaxID=3041620 RepID=UPI002482A1AD|nr:PP2C family protein-serine/threonine phosphatase [Catellatospora sp. KI3]MDI1462736.1 PP2C family protein-serine/threonine phosphatase [Catellatospora sp. KI3]
MEYDPRHRALLRLLELTHLARGDDVAGCVSEALAPLDAAATCYLVDEEQQHLHPLPGGSLPATGPLAVDGTVAGRAFTLVRAQPGDGTRLWLPLVDGTERLGVVEFGWGSHAADPATLPDWAQEFVNLTGHLIAVKLPYGDTLHQTRRTRPMTVAAELLLGMLPPRTFTCDRLVVSSLLQPSYDVGGDGFDYALDGPTARFHVLDAMGRGLKAAVMAVTALAAIRSARRDGHGLHTMARAADEALREQFGQSGFATAVLAELDLDTGRLHYLNAGHPPPLLLRGQHAVRELDAGRRLPLGIDSDIPHLGSEQLEPGDRLLLYTDGVIEARDPDGDLFGVERLTDHAEQAAQAQLPAPETLRILSRRVLDFQHGPARDDATLLLVDWLPTPTTRPLP